MIFVNHPTVMICNQTFHRFITWIQVSFRMTAIMRAVLETL